VSIKNSTIQQMEKCKLLLTWYPEIVGMTARAGRSADLIFACNVGPNITAVNWRDAEGITPLHHAAFNCNTAAFEALLERGADGTQPHPQDPGSSVVRSCVASSKDGKEKLRVLLARYPELLAKAAGRRRSMDVIAICAADPPAEALNYLEPGSGTSTVEKVAYGCSPAAFAAIMDKGPFIPSGVDLRAGMGGGYTSPTGVGFTGGYSDFQSKTSPFSSSQHFGVQAAQGEAYGAIGRPFSPTSYGGQNEYHGRRTTTSGYGNSAISMSGRMRQRCTVDGGAYGGAYGGGAYGQVGEKILSAAAQGRSEDVVALVHPFMHERSMPNEAMNVTDGQGYTALQLTALKCSASAFVALLEAGWDPRRETPYEPGSTVLSCIKTSPFEPLAKAKLLMEACPDILCTAASKGRSEELFFACNAGPNNTAVNWRDGNGISVAHHAAYLCSLPAFEALIERGADGRCPHPQERDSTVVRSCMASPKDGAAKCRVLLSYYPDMLNSSASRQSEREFNFIMSSST